MRFSTLLQVPSSKDGRLMSMLCKSEPKLAKSSGYQVKLIERSGKPLSNMFDKSLSVKKCHRTLCPACVDFVGKGSPKCGLKSVVYAGTCLQCDKTHKSNPSSRHKGLYIGQTYRTLAERAKEHRQSFKDLENGSFMFKHWYLEHRDSVSPPKFQFKVIQQHKDPLSRMIHEAILISDKASLNSKAEWKGYRLARLTVEKSDKETKKHLEKGDLEELKLNQQLSVFKSEILRNRASSANNIVTNNFSSSRKRKIMTGAKTNEKRTGISTQRGSWTPTTSRFVKRSRKSAPNLSNFDAMSPVIAPQAAPAAQGDSEIGSEVLKSDGSEADLLNQAIDLLASPVSDAPSDNVFSEDLGEENSTNEGGVVAENLVEVDQNEGAETNEVNADEDTSQESLLESEKSQSSVSNLLNGAMDDASVFCGTYWWKTLSLDESLREFVAGRGIKRKACSCNPLFGARLKRLRSSDLCEELSALCVSSLPTKHSIGLVVPRADDATDIATVKDLNEVTLKLKSLNVCECQEDHCLPCTLSGLNALCDAANWESSLPAKHLRDVTVPPSTDDSNTHENQDLTTQETSDAALTCENLDLSSTSQQLGLQAQSIEPLNPLLLDSECRGLATRLDDGSCFTLGKVWHVGRFLVKTWFTVAAPSASMSPLSASALTATTSSHCYYPRSSAGHPKVSCPDYTYISNYLNFRFQTCQYFEGHCMYFEIQCKSHFASPDHENHPSQQMN